MKLFVSTVKDWANLWTVQACTYQVAYRIHDVFHVSQLKKCIKVPTEILEPQDIEIEPDLSYAEYPIKILDTKERSTRREKVKMYKIQWNHHTEEEATWETENFLQRNFPDFLRTNSGIKHFYYFSSCNLGARFLLGGRL